MESPQRKEREMSDMSPGPLPSTKGSVPEAAGGDLPEESELPGLQGLDEGLGDAPSDADSANGDPDRASEAGSVSGTGIGDAPTGSSDPMPDMAGTGGS
jgi:hypothetical protein